MNANQSLWIGFRTGGGRFYLGQREMLGGVCLLGQSSSDLATLIAYASTEASFRTLVIDIGGYASKRISGYLATYAPSYFLYDAMKIDGANPDFHAQLIASAYSTALDLSFEQEAVLGAVCQQVALEDGVASPMALAERMESADPGGSASKRLRGRLNALTTLSVVGEADVLAKMFAQSAILDLHESMTPEVAELSAALLFAKLIAKTKDGSGDGPEVVVVLQANRVFKGRPIFRQNLRLLSAFVAHPIAHVLASDVRYGLDDRFLDTGAVKLLSGEVWNNPGKQQVLAPGMFALRNTASGYEEALLPRVFEYKQGTILRGTGGGKSDSSLVKEILEAISTFGDSTRNSLVSYISPGRSREAVEKELDRLVKEGYVQLVGKKLRKDSSHNVLKLTGKGSEFLKGGA